MQEEFLHYVWRFQQFHKNNLQTSDHQKIVILKNGILNTHSGPDFENCRLIINDIEWVGSVEIHVNASDWNQHNHQADEAYDKVILHVVWENDREVFRSDHTKIPVLELKNITFENALKNYKILENNNNEFPCEPFFQEISQIAKFDMLEKALASRLEMKAGVLREWLKDLNNDLEELAFRVFLQNLGFKLNSETFLRLSKSIPFKILKRHHDNLFQLEALLFGMAGFLENPQDEYSNKLSTEFQFLGKKYQIIENRLKRSEWRFLRTRPGNFPTIRIAQLAAIIHKNQNLFTLFVESTDKKAIFEGLSSGVSEYWKVHYDFGKMTRFSKNNIGKSSIENLIVNTVCQLLSLTADQKNQYLYFEKAVNFLTEIPAENNFIIRKYLNLGIEVNNAFDSQALIQQYQFKCQPKKCLSCSVGTEILKRKT